MKDGCLAVIDEEWVVVVVALPCCALTLKPSWRPGIEERAGDALSRGEEDKHASLVFFTGCPEGHLIVKPDLRCV